MDAGGSEMPRSVAWGGSCMPHSWGGGLGDHTPHTPERACCSSCVQRRSGIGLVASLCGLRTSAFLLAVLTTALSNCSIKGIHFLLLERGVS